MREVKNIVADALPNIPPFIAKEVVVATWNRAGYYSSNTDKVTKY